MIYKWSREFKNIDLFKFSVLVTISMSSPNYKFKIIIMGMESVGKTSLIRRYVDDKFSESYIPTLLTDFTTKQVNYKGKIVRLLLYELGGHEQFRIDQKRHFQKADYICVVTSISPEEKESVKKLPNLVKIARENWKDLNDGAYVPIVIIVNKTDLIDNERKDIVIYQYKKIIKVLGTNFNTNGSVFTSAKTGDGVDLLFHKITAELLRRRD